MAGEGCNISPPLIPIDRRLGMNGITFHELNIDRVCIKYATDDNDQLCGVVVRGINEDILPLLDPEARILERINAQIKAAKEFNEESKRKDEGTPMERRMAEQGGSEPDGPEVNDDGYPLDGDRHDSELCEVADCEEPECVQARKDFDADRHHEEAIDRKMEEVT
jgi:hypothetical protein